MSRFARYALVALVLAGAAAAPALAAPDGEAKLLATIKNPTAPLFEKAEACRMLQRVGTAKCVPVLATLLDDEKLASRARNAMERIEDPSVDVVLRDAAGKLKGLRLVGVIGSIGVRRDAKAVGLLVKHLDSDDETVARAAARALGSIGTPEAGAALQAKLTDGKAGTQLHVCEGLLRCAECLTAAGKADAALAIYDKIRALPKPARQVRTAALRGAVLIRKAEGLPILMTALRDKDYLTFAVATRISRELPGEAVTEALAGELPKLPADRQILLAQVLGARGDQKAGSALMALAGKGEEKVRIEAVRALMRLGHAPALTLLVDLALKGEGALADQARAGLAAFTGEGGQEAMLSLMQHKNPAARCLAIEMIAQRSPDGAAASLIKAASDRDESVRLAALKALRDLAGAGDLPALIDLLTGAKADADRKAVEAAIRSLCSRQSQTVAGQIVIRRAVYGDLPSGKQADVTKKVARLVKRGATSVEASNTNFGDPVQGTPKKLRVDYVINGMAMSKTVPEKEKITFSVSTAAPPAMVAKIAAAVADASKPAKLALLRLLRNTGGAKALATVQAAAKDADADVKETALRALVEWPSADALPAVMQLARTASGTMKILALRGWIRLAAQQASAPADKVASLKAALAMAQRDDEKRLAISALGTVPSPAALALVMPFVDSASLKEEACLAAVSIAEGLRGRPRAEARTAMQKVVKTTRNRKLAARARALTK